MALEIFETIKLNLIIYCISIIRLLIKVFHHANLNKVVDGLICIEKLLLIIYTMYCNFGEFIEGIFSSIIQEISNSGQHRNFKIILFEILYTLITGKARCVDPTIDPEAYELLKDEV